MAFCCGYKLSNQIMLILLVYFRLLKFGIIFILGFYVSMFFMFQSFYFDCYDSVFILTLLSISINNTVTFHNKHYFCQKPNSHITNKNR